MTSPPPQPLPDAPYAEQSLDHHGQDWSEAQERPLTQGGHGHGRIALGLDALEDSGPDHHLPRGLARRRPAQRLLAVFHLLNR
eukprot:15472707-Alexandrium_andersonii.AAC.1